MPKLFEYLGLIIRFFSNEHDPIHVHAFYENYQTKIDFIVKNGIIIDVKYSKVKGYEMIPLEKIKDLKKLIEVYKYEIIQLWIKYFVLHESIKSKKITTKL